jgi:hypothetical protein
MIISQPRFLYAIYPNLKNILAILENWEKAEKAIIDAAAEAKLDAKQVAG